MYTTLINQQVALKTSKMNWTLFLLHGNVKCDALVFGCWMLFICLFCYCSVVRHCVLMSHIFAYIVVCLWCVVCGMLLFGICCYLCCRLYTVVYCVLVVCLLLMVHLLCVVFCLFVCLCVSGWRACSHACTPPSKRRVASLTVSSLIDVVASIWRGRRELHGVLGLNRLFPANRQIGV